jgi:hypothetical protein
LHTCARARQWQRQCSALFFATNTKRATTATVVAPSHSPTRSSGIWGHLTRFCVWSVYFYTPPGCERGIDQQSLEFIQQKCRPHRRRFEHSKSWFARCHSGINHRSRGLSKTSTVQSNVHVFIASNQEARAENGRRQRADSRRASVRIHKCGTQRACLSPTNSYHLKEINRHSLQVGPSQSGRHAMSRGYSSSTAEWREQRRLAYVRKYATRSPRGYSSRTAGTARTPGARATW